MNYYSYNITHALPCQRNKCKFLKFFTPTKRIKAAAFAALYAFPHQSKKTAKRKFGHEQNIWSRRMGGGRGKIFRVRRPPQAAPFSRPLKQSPQLAPSAAALYHFFEKLMQSGRLQKAVYFRSEQNALSFVRTATAKNYEAAPLLSSSFAPSARFTCLTSATARYLSLRSSIFSSLPFRLLMR